MSVYQKINRFIIPVFICVTVLILLRNLNPLVETIWVGHDETQAARVAQFTVNIKNGILPPRIAPNFSYGMGFPVFNHYAPTAYWITGSFHLMGLSIPQALKISYALALLLGGIGMYLLVLKTTTNRFASMIASILYISSPYVAAEIFVRSNLGEMWIFAFLPIALFGLKTTYHISGIINTFILSLLFTSHNALSLLAITIIILTIMIEKNKLRNSVSLIMAVLLGAYFFIPSFGELHLTHAVNVAKKTLFTDHFLCPIQLWSGQWGFGGSVAGCSGDGMSFMLGKVLLISACVGGMYLLFEIIRKKNIKQTFPLLILIITLISAGMMFPISSRLWEYGISVFQFPWRFLLIVLFGCVYLAGWIFSHFAQKALIAITIVVLLYTVTINAKYFRGQMISSAEFTDRYLSYDYIGTKAAYRIPEYLPISAQYQYWLGGQNKNYLFDTQSPRDVRTISPTYRNPFLFDVVPPEQNTRRESQSFYIPIHWMPYWKIVQDDKPIIPHEFDLLGRPIIQSKTDHIITIRYEQTPLQKASNLISVCSFLMLAGWGIMALRMHPSTS